MPPIRPRLENREIGAWLRVQTLTDHVRSRFQEPEVLARETRGGTLNVQHAQDQRAKNETANRHDQPPSEFGVRRHDAAFCWAVQQKLHCKFKSPDMPPKFQGNCVFFRTWARTEICPLFHRVGVGIGIGIEGNRVDSDSDTDSDPDSGQIALPCQEL